MKMSQRSKRTLVLSSICVFFITVYCLLHSTRDIINETYNPLTYRYAVPRTEEPQRSEVPPLLDHDELSNRLNTQRHRCSVYTFFNDEQVTRLSIQEQQYHKTMLRKFITLYHSLGFNIHVMHHRDATQNENMSRMMARASNAKVNDNYLRLLAWQTKLKETGEVGGLYSDYEIFPTSGFKLEKLYRDKMGQFTLMDDYEFQVMMSDSNGIDSLIRSLAEKRTDFEIFETGELSGVFADYTLATWRKLLNTNDLRQVMDEVPKYLNKHLHRWRLSQFDTITIVDPVTLSDHYFSRSIFQTLKSLLHCPNALFPPPTNKFMAKFEKDILPHLPARLSMDSHVTTQRENTKALTELMKPHIFECKKQWRVEVSSELVRAEKQLTFVTVPHPVSVSAALHFNDKHTITSDELVHTKRRDMVTDMLKVSLDEVVNDTSILFFNAELLSTKGFVLALGLHLGFSIPAVNDQWGLEFHDLSTAFNEIINEEYTISEGEFKRKMDSVKALVQHYESPHSYVINQRQSEAKMKEYRAKIKASNKYDTVSDLEQRVLNTQSFESRHDPVVDIAEMWNPQDTQLWWLVQSLRFVDEHVYQLMSRW